jgi:hypothetical protein
MASSRVVKLHRAGQPGGSPNLQASYAQILCAGLTPGTLEEEMVCLCVSV